MEVRQIFLGGGRGNGKTVWSDSSDDRGALGIPHRDAYVRAAGRYFDPWPRDRRAIIGHHGGGGRFFSRSSTAFGFFRMEVLQSQNRRQGHSNTGWREVDGGHRFHSGWHRSFGAR